MAPALCGVVFAAGEGTRLRPLTNYVPKPLCPVGNVPLLDRALARLAQHRFSGPAMVAVNACYLADQLADHVGGRAYVSREPGPHPLGTSGALGHLKDWIAGRAVLAGNADAYLNPTGGAKNDLAPLLSGWDGTTVRVLAVPGRPAEFTGSSEVTGLIGSAEVTGLIGSAEVTGLIGSAEVTDLRFAGFSLIPADLAAALPAEKAELVTTVWRPAERAGRLEVIRYDGEYLDTGTPANLLAANLDAAGGGSVIAPDATIEGKVDRSVVGAGAIILGTITRSLVFPGARVAPDEHLVDAIRLGTDVTVQTQPREELP
jgi:N-acetyl-alpha-D-muramate 1-phosphate uridylyltransferase